MRLILFALAQQAPRPAGAHRLELAFAAALHPVFVAAGVVALAAFLLAWLLHDVPLLTRTQVR